MYLKKISSVTLVAFLLAAAVSYSSGCSTSSDSEDTIPVVDPVELPINSALITNEVKNIGYLFDGDNIIFIFDETIRAIKPTTLSIKASFNSWNETNSWPLEKSTMTGVWFLVKLKTSVIIPGNSGYPEFGFQANNKWTDVPSSTPAGYKFGNNALIIFDTADLPQIIANETIALTFKQLTDFDLNTEQGKMDLSNFRPVPGSTQLYRSYHPFYAAKKDATESKRIELVKSLMESTGIKTEIDLSENDKTGTISAYHQALITAGHRLYATTTYNTVFFASNSKTFGNLIKSIVVFINRSNNQAPVLVHCSLGADRTGVVCAVLAALTGATWGEITTDFEKTNNMGIKEFRSSRILQYSFTLMLGANPADSTDLKADLSTYFINGGYLTEQQITDLNTKLQ